MYYDLNCKPKPQKMSLFTKFSLESKLILFGVKNNFIWDKKYPIWGTNDFIWGTEKFIL